MVITKKEYPNKFVVGFSSVEARWNPRKLCFEPYNGYYNYIYQSNTLMTFHKRPQVRLEVLTPQFICFMRYSSMTGKITDECMDRRLSNSPGGGVPLGKGPYKVFTVALK